MNINGTVILIIESGFWIDVDSLIHCQSLGVTGENQKILNISDIRSFKFFHQQKARLPYRLKRI